VISTAVATYADEQRHYWRGADPSHFRWQTRGYIGRTEAALLAHVAVEPGDRLLEIGCGEGANLHHLAGRGAHLHGIDFTADKARFAAAETGARTAAADAAHLPFATGSFDAVLIRDVLHHLPDRAAVLAEAARVLRAGGRLTVIEPNGRSPLVFAQAAAIPAERGVRVSTGPRLVDEVTAAGFVDVRLSRAQPLPVSRVFLHHKLGAASLGESTAVAWALSGLERAASILPPALWTYLIVNASRRAF